MQEQFGPGEADLQFTFSVGDLTSPERPGPTVDGVERKELFSGDEQSKIIQKINNWFEENKQSLPERGINITVPRIGADGLPTDSLNDLTGSTELPEGVTLPEEVSELFAAIMRDSASDPVLGRMDLKLSLRRTGDLYTHPDNLEYHVDTSRYDIASDGTFTRSPERSVGKYMAFIGRPGTVVIDGKLDPALTQQEGTALAPEEGTIPDRGVSQLLPNSVYKVAVGDLLHAAPSHQDGLLFEVSFSDTDDSIN